MKRFKLDITLIHLIVLSFTLFSVLNACESDEGPYVELEVVSPPSVSGEEESFQKRITLTEDQSSSLNIETHRVTREIANYTISVSGEVFAAPSHMAVVSTPVDGRVTRIMLHEGEAVKQGEALLEMESLQFAELIASFLEAQAEKIYLEQQVKRLDALVASRISSQSSLDRAEADLARITTRVRAARARLQAVGIKNREMDQWNTTQVDTEELVLTVYAPIDGKINQHLVDLGKSVQANTMLMDIVDNRRVLVRGYLDPDDIRYLKPGVRTIVRQLPSGDGNRRMMAVETEIASIQPGLDPQNKAIIVNSIVDSSDQWPVIGQSIRVEYEASTQSKVVTIPLSAIHFEGQNAMVFVKRDEREFEARPIVLERILQDSAIVASGLFEGEKIATTQIFSLKALGKFEEFSED